ncbi:MAG: flagellar basal body L-ring protein FlgH, partial [Ghiorsea sp.]|nr:flagellar basal body L-ring protein FlgH [Ghiorsea sp.]
MNKIATALFSLLLLQACTATKAQVTEDVNKPIVEQALQATEHHQSHTGSLWNNSGSNMFTDPKAHRVGDLVMVLVQESASATRSLGTKKSRSSKHTSSLSALFGLEKSIAPN